MWNAKRSDVRFLAQNRQVRIGAFQLIVTSTSQWRVTVLARLGQKRRAGRHEANPERVRSDTFPAFDPCEDREFLLMSIGWDERIDGPAYDLFGRVAVEPLCPFVPGRNDRGEIGAYDRVIAGFDDLSKPPAAFLTLAQFSFRLAALDQVGRLPGQHIELAQPPRLPRTRIFPRGRTCVQAVGGNAEHRPVRPIRVTPHAKYDLTNGESVPLHGRGHRLNPYHHR